MNKIMTAMAAALVAMSGSAAQTSPDSSLPAGAVSDAAVERSESNLLVSLKIHPDAFSRKANREVWITPVVVSGADSLWLAPVVVAGRTRYYQNLRAEDNPAYVMLRSGSSEAYSYSQTAAWQPWMEQGELLLVSRLDGCCGDRLADAASMPLEAFDFRPKVLRPQFAYVKPAGEITKTRTVKGEAYIDFPVNRTDILPDYRRNPQELAEIRRTIDEVRLDKDVEITSLAIKGFASPEGSYANNEHLARGRTEALIRYVGDLYSFPKAVMHSDWEAEDWQGLESRVEAMEIADKEALLAVIRDTSLAPDLRDAKLKKSFPAQYAVLLAEVYPALRHSDYNVQFVVRNYKDNAEIAGVMATAPQKLSLEELFSYAQSLDRNSPEFKEVMEVAVRMFPADPVANLNAATTAVANGDYARARDYLAKAGDSPEAAYTAGVLEALEGNYAKAKPLLEKASRANISFADDILADMHDWGWID